ncbi:type II toxin-antitoxin system HicB family antitoxin [Citrobacter portucalensis]|uniref:type II toxin-antitoxin system HicB family antitoxin n=1 Tax=Citrobacter portucalensis TaxID=1639133 RepID=UPI00226B57BB|nr:type II toxin-antitoxin system HicB family antitoxin [Citrobacter portucalensis]MCX9019050.1 type II toxin-antitoxin system HicB family antitoxin [Citrobacter portucalensis]
MRYPATLIKKPNGSYSVTFPDQPEAEHAAGADISDALNEGRRAFLKALPLYVLDNEALPRPSAAHPRYSITLSMDDSFQACI